MPNILTKVISATVWVRRGEKWQAVFHGENLIFDPKAPQVADKKEESKKEGPRMETAATPGPAKAVADLSTDAMMATEKSVSGSFRFPSCSSLQGSQSSLVYRGEPFYDI